MSDVENEACPILKRMMVGARVILGVEEQVAIRAWIVLRAMILERAASARKSMPFYTQEDRTAFANAEVAGSLEPMDGVYIWLFHFKSGQWVARSNVANTGVHATAGQTPHHVQVVTAFVGQLGFQVLAGRWPTGRRLAMNSAAVRESEPATKLLWPDPLERYRWPPHSGYLADDTLMPFMDRFLAGGFPLQRGTRKR